MDDLDRHLITLLRHNGRRSISDLAQALSVSRATLRNRMERLEASGEILGYTVILRADAVAQPVRGLMMIKVQGRTAERVVARLSALPEVQEIHTTNGQWDLIAELGTATLTDLDEVLRRIRDIPGILGSETNLMLATPRSTRARLSGRG
ncbi:transcriptional regulator, AsnC family [Pseudooceanicola antarcticus]|uniref:Lrp/AsnC family transcriptional regulator n=1 Tax=Pseudooceanicola antarcticus TaxID=1247613 RepID=A0A285JFC7_9RHOB|nr:Lrp/AsnC family transcriptional regulator [Pseudooceanicola antarcticus]PJE30921.1 Lrp/AsnC family transcriptional regulator [Pseudooceanicola antarcticus]SNY57861.1 transcriptional regulator, AsnC family [Pseudooceanicola antarcticus]